MQPPAPLALADDVLERNFEGIVPATPLERNILAGPITVSVEAVRLGHDLFRTFKAAAYLRTDQTVADRYPANRIWGLSITKVSEYLARVLDDGFTVDTQHLSWLNTMDAIREACLLRSPGAVDEVDVAARLRLTLESSLRSARNSPAGRDAAWQNFQMALRVLGPIFSGEITRADLSA